eukprot:7133683-Prymnesium_polylepis.1
MVLPSLDSPAGARPVGGRGGVVCVNELRGRGTRTWHACGTRERRDWGPTQRSHKCGVCRAWLVSGPRAPPGAYFCALPISNLSLVS